MKRFFLLFICVILLATGAQASRKCLEQYPRCEPDLLCTMKTQWYAANIYYVIYSVSNPYKKGIKKPADGLPYEGTYYDDAVRRAKEQFPNLGRSDLAREAGQIFEERAEKIGNDLYELPTCEFGGKPTESFLPSSLYKGMSTDEECKISVEYDKRQYPVDEFAKEPGGICEELLQAAYIHEQLHYKECLPYKGKPIKPQLEIANLIRDEAHAYDVQRKILEAEYRLLSIRCSDRPKNPNEEKVRMKKLNQLLKGYQTRLQDL